MNISKSIRERISKFKPGVIFGLKDFTGIENPQSVILELSRLSKKGVIERLTKGKYFVPKISRFGKLRPSGSQILDQIIKQNGGYFAGGTALNRMGVTTQIPSQVTIRGARSTRKLRIGNLTIKMIREGNPEADYEQSGLTDLIETARLIKKIPDGNVELTIHKITGFLKSLKSAEISQLIKLLNNERPYVRAVIGAIMEQNKIPLSQKIKASLNPVTTYRIGLNKTLLSNGRYWRII